jgi:hypothetical protein
MDLSGLREKTYFPGDSIIKLVLVFFIIFGLVTKFFISFFLRLDSDSVGLGLMSMEIGKYHNYFLSGCHLLSTDSLVFTELIPFQLIPQILTNYNPFSLKIMVFILFVLSVLVFAYIVYFITGEIFPALLFAALAMNISHEGYFWLAYPTTHNATILFGGLILLILLYLDRSLEHKTEKKTKTRKKDPSSPSTIPWTFFILLMVLVFISVLSDTLILIWVIIPFIIAYLLIYKRRTNVMNIVVFSLSFIAVLAYIIKTYFIRDWLGDSYGIKSIHDIFLVNIPLFVKAQVMFLNHGLFTFIEGNNNLGLIEVISAIIFIVAIGYILKNLWLKWETTTVERKFFTTILISILLIFCSFSISSYAYNITAARYMTFTVLALLMLVAVSSTTKDRIFLWLILSLLICSMISTSIYVSTMNLNPNEREYDLIAFLSNHNLSYGYGTYWDSNIITYLSGENVVIRSTYFFPDDIRPTVLNSCDRWLANRPSQIFLINDTTLLSEKAQHNFPLLINSDNQSNLLHYRDYEIFPFNGTE